jgi:hypothetical protein
MARRCCMALSFVPDLSGVKFIVRQRVPRGRLKRRNRRA